MIKFLVIMLSATSLCWASGYYDNNYRQPYQSYEDNYYSPYSSSHQPHLSKDEILKTKTTIINTLKDQAARNASSCTNRQECLKLDQESLKNLQEKYRKHTYLQDFFSVLSSKLSQAIESDNVVSELLVYSSLSDGARRQYLDGIRINDPREAARAFMSKHTTTQLSRQTSKVVKFNLDDLKMYILQQIEKNHQGCRGRESCLQSDIRSVTDAVQIIAKNDPDRSNLEQLADLMQEEAFKQPFNTIRFYEGYYATLTQQQPFLYKSPEQIEWNQLVKNMRLAQRRDPQILNQAEVKEESKVETQMKHQLEKQGEDLVGSIFGQLNGNGSDQGQGGLLGSLFGR